MEQEKNIFPQLYHQKVFVFSQGSEHKIGMPWRCSCKRSFIAQPRWFDQLGGLSNAGNLCSVNYMYFDKV